MIMKLSGLVVVLSMVAVLCTGCARSGYKAQDNSLAASSAGMTEEEQWSAVLEKSSAVADSGSEGSGAWEESSASGGGSGSMSPALLDSLRYVQWYVGPEVYYHKYREPGLMENTGMFYGVVAGVTSRYWVPSSPQERPWPSKWMARAEGRFAYGQLDYEGSTWDGTPVKTNNIDDFMWEIRLLMGPDFPGTTTMLTPFGGIAYRYLNDDSSSHVGGYARESNYLYIPVGLEVIGQLDGGWSWGGAIEFDVFIWGEQRSHLSDIGFSDVDNRQETGYGVRASVKLQKKTDKMDFIIEPFIRYWDIADSEVETVPGIGGVLEPENTTVEAGVRLIFGF